MHLKNKFSGVNLCNIYIECPVFEIVYEARIYTKYFEILNEQLLIFSDSLGALDTQLFNLKRNSGKSG